MIFYRDHETIRGMEAVETGTTPTTRMLKGRGMRRMVVRAAVDEVATIEDHVVADRLEESEVERGAEEARREERCDEEAGSIEAISGTG